MTTKRKTNPNHKCLAVRAAYQTTCSCGWSGTSQGSRAAPRRTCEHEVKQEERA